MVYDLLPCGEKSTGRAPAMGPKLNKSEAECDPDLSGAGAPAMLFQLAGSPVQRRGPLRFTSAPHEDTILIIIPLPPFLPFTSNVMVPPFSIFPPPAAQSLLLQCALGSCFTLNR